MTIDPSGKTGWCHGIFGQKPVMGLYDLTGDRLTRKMLNLQAFLTNLISGNRVQRVYIEAPIIANQNGLASIRSAMSINIAVGMTCTKLGIDCYDIDQQTWRSGFMKTPHGTGITQAPRLTDEQIMALLIDARDPDAVRQYHATMTDKKRQQRKTEARRRWMKNRTMQECAKRGHPVDDDNVADALGMWLMLEAKAKDKGDRPTFDLLGGLAV